MFNLHKIQKIKTTVLPAFVLFCVCFFTTAGLAVTNYFTAPVIEKNNNETAFKIYHEFFPEASDFQAQVFNFEGNTYDLVAASQNGRAIGYIYKIANNGYGGPVVCLIAVDQNKQLRGVDVLEMSETPNLGDKAKDKRWLAQYLGKSGALKVVKTKVASDDEIVAITGATITSNCVTKSVNMALNFAEIMDKDGYQVTDTDNTKADETKVNNGKNDKVKVE